jgi:hypothetical protein
MCVLCGTSVHTRFHIRPTNPTYSTVRGFFFVSQPIRVEKPRTKEDKWHAEWQSRLHEETPELLRDIATVCAIGLCFDVMVFVALMWALSLLFVDILFVFFGYPYACSLIPTTY